MADGITRIAVEGFKSIVNRQEIEIAPLTILAGANSSGKSSIMQPLLMLKQTLEWVSDEGPLFISGPNVRFTSADQFISNTSSSSRSPDLVIEIALQAAKFCLTLQKSDTGLELLEQKTVDPSRTLTLRANMTAKEIAAQLQERPLLDGLRVARNRFFLGVTSVEMPWASVAEWVVPTILAILHVPALRGTTLRSYPVAAVGAGFPGTFDHYAASVIFAWQRENSRRYECLIDDMHKLGVARNLLAKRLDAEMQLLVNRAGDTPYDMVSIADVGFGVSQVLPVLVALRTANEGQLVYLEEPEIHLHPRAQVRLADILADAAKRGVRVVAETHSSLLLRAIQTLIAKEGLPADLVKLHWFSRDSEGVTQIKSVTPDENGAFGDWPEDFGDVALQSEKDYLDAVESKLAR